MSNNSLSKLDTIIDSLGGGLSGVSSTGADITIRPDGKKALVVDTEIVLNVDNVTLDNLKLTANIATPRHYELSGIDLSGTILSLSGTAISVLVSNISTSNDGQVSFDGGTGWYDIPKNYGGIALDSSVFGKLQISTIKIRAKTNTIDAQIITVEV